MSTSVVRPALVTMFKNFIALTGLLSGLAMSVVAFAQTTPLPAMTALLNVDLVGRVSPPYGTSNLVAAGNYVYVTDTTNLYIISIANPALPAVVGQYPVYGGVDVKVQGNLVYLSTDRGVAILNVSVPSSPYLIYQFNGGAIISATSKYAYIGNGSAWSSGTLVDIYDVSTPTAPVKVGQVNFGTAAGTPVIAGNYLYVSAGQEGLRIYDISNPAAPTQVGSFPQFGGINVIAGNTGYAFSYGWLQLIDLSNPIVPKLLSTYTQLHSGTDVAVSGNYAYVADMYYGVRVIDVSARTMPVLAGYYAEANTHVKRVAIAGNYVIIGQGVWDSDPNGGVRVLRNMAPSRCTAALTLGAGANYNGFFTSDFNASNVSVQGKVVSGGNVALSSFSLGSGVSNPIQDVLIAGGNASLTNGSLLGNVVYGGTLTKSGAYVAGTQRQATPIDFLTAQQDLYNLFVHDFIDVVMNGAWTIQQLNNTPEYSVTFTGTDPKLNAAYIYDSLLTNARTIKINAPATSTVVITVLGAPTFQNVGFSFVGVRPEHVLLNVNYGVTLNNASVPVSILSQGDIVMNGGALGGQVIAHSFSGSGALNNNKFTGCVPIGVADGQIVLPQ